MHTIKNPEEQGFTKVDEYMYTKDRSLYCIVDEHNCSTYSEFQRLANLTDEQVFYYKLKYGTIEYTVFGRTIQDYIPIFLKG